MCKILLVILTLKASLYGQLLHNKDSSNAVLYWNNFVGALTKYDKSDLRNMIGDSVLCEPCFDEYLMFHPLPENYQKYKFFGKHDSFERIEANEFISKYVPIMFDSTMLDIFRSYHPKIYRDEPGFLVTYDVGPDPEVGTRLIFVWRPSISGIPRFRRYTTSP